MSMDPWLATVYGTNGGAAEDLEKIAQAEMAQQLAQQEGVDLSNLSEEQVAQLGNEVLGSQGQPGAPQAQQAQPGMQQGAQMQEPGFDPSQLTEEHVNEAQQVLSNPEAYAPEIVQEAQAIMQVVEQHLQAQQGGQPQAAEMAKVAEANAKFEEADFLGRVMAHAFNQESEKIAASKQAGFMGSAAEHLRGAGHAAVEAGHAAAGHLKNFGGAVKHHAGAAAGAAKHHAGSALSHIKNHQTAYAAGAAGAAGLGAGYAAGHHMNKEATVAAIEKAAQIQAANILQANNIDPATGQPLQPQAPMAPAIAPAGGVQPQQGAQAALGDLVEKRAHQILRSLGYSI